MDLGGDFLLIAGSEAPGDDEGDVAETLEGIVQELVKVEYA